jgi:hypothetical protein
MPQVQSLLVYNLHALANGLQVSRKMLELVSEEQGGEVGNAVDPKVGIWITATF